MEVGTSVIAGAVVAVTGTHENDPAVPPPITALITKPEEYGNTNTSTPLSNCLILPA
jgi:hypothetical protein